MSAYVDKTITCMCCGEKQHVRLLKGYSVLTAMDLDTNPHTPALYDRVFMCSNCGYATSEPYTSIDDDVRRLVKSENYLTLFKDHQYDVVSKKLVLAGYLAANKKNYREAGYDYLMAYWSLKENMHPKANNACEKAIKYFELYLSDNADLEVALILIDCMRQQSHFTDALETAISLDSYLEDSSHLKNILAYEKQLITNSDSSSHKIDEVRG